jgi:hypothetical protein
MRFTKCHRQRLPRWKESIATHCAELIEDGACLQMGIGGIPNAVLKALGNHKNLGIHTEMFSDGVIELVEKGVITGTNKRVHPGKLVAAFIMGSRRLYDFVDDNPLVAVLDVAYVNDTAVIRRNPKVSAINSAIEIDLTGQVGADSMGHPPIFWRGWADGFYPWCVSLRKWQTDHRTAVGHQERHFADHTPSAAGHRRRHHARSCPLCGD